MFLCFYAFKNVPVDNALEAPAQDEAMAHQEVAVAHLEAETVHQEMRGRHNKRQHDNQTMRQKAVAR